MKVILAKSAGFCFGVKRALELAEKTVEENQTPIYTYGPIIHNEQVIAELENKGVTVMKEDSAPDEYPAGTVILRSHGVSREVYESILSAGHKIVDATCPFVAKIHKIVDDNSGKDAHIVIIGDKSHPEVMGITGWVRGENVTVINEKADAEAFFVPKGKKVCVVSQTTYNLTKFQELVEIIKQKGYDITVLNTICSATEERQKEAAEVAHIVDAMIVIGGRNSSNSRKLFEICSAICGNTVFIQKASDLDRDAFSSCETIGITAGASTPYNIIQEVLLEWQRKVLTSC